jgi:ACS family tartrate transporter-like MFS transporter
MTMRKVYLRILPFAALTYFFCYLDRINVGFAALTMNKDIRLDAATGTAAASGIAWVNSLGNLGGFFGPTMVGGPGN